MEPFAYRAGELCAEAVALSRIAAEQGTPLYCYSRAALTARYRAFDEAFARHPHLTCYSVKALSNLAVLQVLAGLGSGFDVVSGGELRRALRAGADPRRIVFSGVGKTDDEIAEALEASILMFNVESRGELDAIDEVARRVDRRAPVAMRVNPDIDPETHPYITTGLRENKFGMHVEDARAAYLDALQRPHVEVVGLDFHIGSQLTNITPVVASLERALSLVHDVRERGAAIRYLDVGGGLGITYNTESPPSVAQYADALLGVLERAGEAKLGLTLVLEPGRSIVGNAGVLVTRVLYVKQTGHKVFVIVDAGMNDLLRPSLYKAHHTILPLTEGGRGPARPVDVVGPVCETGDFLARDRALPEVRRGDLLAVMSAGAYGHVMASNYNTRGRPPEVLVDGERHHVVREREVFEDMLHGERLLT
jgi:diaminopimelate decarboxylase